jgi:proton-coupled amino acid transporter
MTPNTRKTFKNQIDEENTGKIGPAGTFFTLLKGFVASGVLFLPKGFVTGGWLFSSVVLSLSCVLTIVCSLKLIAIRKKYKLSFSQIGFKAYGTPGKMIVDFFLAFTQTIFVCAYVAFITNSVNGISTALFNFEINKWIMGGV